MRTFRVKHLRFWWVFEICTKPQDNSCRHLESSSIEIPYRHSSISYSISVAWRCCICSLLYSSLHSSQMSVLILHGWREGLSSSAMSLKHKAHSSPIRVRLPEAAILSAPHIWSIAIRQKCTISAVCVACGTLNTHPKGKTVAVLYLLGFHLHSPTSFVHTHRRLYVCSGVRKC